MIKTFKSRLRTIFLYSDLLTTRATVAMSSLMFALILISHYFSVTHWHDLFWVFVSLIHASTAFWSLFWNRVNKFTLVGEAILGFILWNYISASIVTTYSIGMSAFSPAGAPFAPTFVIGMATWWILARYPIIKKK